MDYPQHHISTEGQIKNKVLRFWKSSLENVLGNSGAVRQIFPFILSKIHTAITFIDSLEWIAMKFNT